MDELPPLLAFIREAELADKEAIEPHQPAPVTVPDFPPIDVPATPLPSQEDQGDQSVAGLSHVDGHDPSTTDESSDPVDRVDEALSLSLGSKTVDFQKEDAAPASAPSVLRTVQALHEPGDGTKRPPICYCGAPRLKEVDVHLREDGTGKKKAGVSGIWRCRNGETCPLCVEAATARRRSAYARVGDATIEKGGILVSVVLSVSHGLEDRLADLMTAVKKASTGARAGGPWHRKIKAALGALGVLVDHHVRYGERYGWHYHQHLTIFCLNRDEQAVMAAIDALVQRYLRLLARQGYRATADRQHVKVLREHPEGEAYTYPADHNPADGDDDMEITAADHGEDESLSPMQLAEMAAQGDEQAAALFMEFSAAIRKTRSVVVTPAMATALDIESQGEEPPAYTEQTRLGSIPGKVWTKLLDENLATTFLSRVESAGREHWLAVRWWALEQTGEAPEYSVELANEIAQLIRAQNCLDDPTAKELAQNQLGILQCDWTESHGADLVAATMEYVAANQRHMTVNEKDVDWWTSVLEVNASKIARRRRDAASHTTLPECANPPAAAGVPHGSVPDHVGQKSPISQHA
ncbi:hypothetical protein [Devosia elaeis]|uniref:Replication protein n=1 Tax=Devosia elaeis TaxID=1770058 RepID=A0A178I2Q9_9HYPH|nr:hypothetical protein [Devosia elaeis]OAM79651.1 hypothetical protein A3840_02820 [Devosia elaeis]